MSKTIEEIRELVEDIKEADKRLLALQKRCLWMILVLLMMLSSCDPGLQQGYVYDRVTHPAWTQVIPGHVITICTGGRRSRTCETEYDPPIVIPHPAEYELDISNCRHNVHSSECKTNWVYVSEDVYHAHPIGSYYGGE
jgi:hypothetical protein